MRAGVDASLLQLPLAPRRCSHSLLRSLRICVSTGPSPVVAIWCTFLSQRLPCRPMSQSQAGFPVGVGDAATEDLNDARAAAVAKSQQVLWPLHNWAAQSSAWSAARSTAGPGLWLT